MVLPLLIILAANLGTDPRRIRSPLIGKPAPPFSLRVAGSNEIVTLDSLRGKPAVVNFWATWCVPCHEEHGVLVAAASMQPNVRFIGVVYNDEEPKVLQFLRERGSAYASLMDDGAKTAIAYGVSGVPETFFIDAAGTIRAKFDGPLDPSTLNVKLREVSQ